MNGREVLPSLFAENFSEKSNLDESVICLPVFNSRTNLELHNNALTSVIVKKVIANLDLSKASGPDCMPVVVLKNCGPEIPYIIAELFNECLRQSCFPVLKGITDGPSIEEGLHLKTTVCRLCRRRLSSFFSKIFEKLINNGIVDNLEKCIFFSNFEYGFRSSRSTVDLVTPTSDRIARVC